MNRRDLSTVCWLLLTNVPRACLRHHHHHSVHSEQNLVVLSPLLHYIYSTEHSTIITRLKHISQLNKHTRNASWARP